MEPLRLGFVGAGEMATFALLPALHFAPIRLHAVCDIDEEKARAAAGTFGDQRSGELTGDGVALIEFVTAIREDREPIASIHDAIGTMRLYQAIYDAVCAGRDGAIPI